MPLPYTTFVDGSDLLPEHVNELFSAPKYDGQTQYLNHYPRLVDASLDPNGVLKRVAAMTDPFKVQVETGISVRILGGTFRNEDDVTSVIPDEVIVLPNNASTFIYKDSTGATATSSLLASIPKKRLLLARVVTASGVISTLEDLRGYDQRSVNVNPRSVRLFGGSSLVNKTVTDGETISGLQYFKTVTVPTGFTLNIDKYAIINCQDFICNGTVMVVPATDSTEPPEAIVSPNTFVVALNGNGIGTTGESYNYIMQPYGSAGQSGQVYNYSTTAGLACQAARAGKGGGGLQINASNSIVFSATSTLSAKGTNALNPVFINGSTDYALSGGGGGSGGTVILNSLNTVSIAPGATVDLRGGNGSNVLVTGTRIARGGCGGAGGIIIAASPNLPNFTGATILIAGGTGGVNVGAELSTTFSGGKGGGNATTGGTNAAGSAARNGQSGLLIVTNNLPNG